MRVLNYPGWYLVLALILVGKSWSLLLAGIVALETLRQFMTDP